MARAWETQGKSTVKLPGQAAKRCWRWIHALDLLQFYRRTMARRRTRRILLARRQDMANISRISAGQCGYGRHGWHSQDQHAIRCFRLLPLHLGKSSPVEAYTDYGCLETQGKQWACISGLPAMGAMAIWEGGVVLRAYPWHTTQPYGLVPWQKTSSTISCLYYPSSTSPILVSYLCWFWQLLLLLISLLKKDIIL